MMFLWTHVVKMKTSSRESFESGDGSPSATRLGHRVCPSMFADNLCSDGFLESESEDASQDYFVDLRVGPKASNASSKGVRRWQWLQRWQQRSLG